MAVSRPDYQRESGYSTTQYHFLRGLYAGDEDRRPGRSLQSADNLPQYRPSTTDDGTSTPLGDMSELRLSAGILRRGQPSTSRSNTSVKDADCSSKGAYYGTGRPGIRCGSRRGDDKANRMEGLTTWNLVHYSMSVPN